MGTKASTGKNVLRWIAMPIVAFAVYFVVYMLLVILNHGSMHRTLNDDPSKVYYFLYLLAGFGSVAAACYVAAKIAPRGKNAVMMVFAVFFIVYTVCAAVLALISKTPTDYVMRAFSWIGQIAGAVTAFISGKKKEYF